MKPSFSPDRIVTKAESFLMKRTPLAVLSFANNDKSSTTKTGESTILCKRIDNSAHFVDINPQAQPGKKFTPLAIPLEAMKRKNLQQTNPLHARISMTEPAEYIQHHHPVDPHPSYPLHTETSESSRNKNKRNIPKERVSASLKSRSKGKQKENLEKKDSATRLQRSKPKGQMKEMLKSSSKGERKPFEDAKDIKRRSPPKMGRTNATQAENLPPKSATAQKSSQRIAKQAADSKLQTQQSVKRVSNERKSVKSNTRGREQHTHEKTMERSPLRDTTELDKFVQYNAMRILEKMREQKLQDEFERRLNEERKIALNEGNRRIREANFQRFNLTSKSRSKPKAAWGAGHPNYDKQPRSSSTQKRPRPKIEDEERRRVLGLDHLDEEQIARLRQKALMTMKQEHFDKSEEHRPKKKMNEEEHEDIQRYMVEKKARIEEEIRNKRREDYEDFEKKRRNLEHLFMEIRETREQETKTKKKGKKRTKRRKTHKGESSGLRAQQTLTEPNYQFNKDRDSGDEEYSELYNNYKQIMKSKMSPKEENQRDSSGERKATGKKKKVISPEQIEREFLEKKKKEYKDKYVELSDRVKKKLANQGAREENIRPSKKDRKGHDSSKAAQKGRHGERNEAEKVIMEMDTDNFSDNDYGESESLVINSEDQRRRAAREDSDHESGIPDNSAREIIEAAAIFIQKNYRGYRTRKILIEYINQLNELYQNEQGYDGQEYSDREERHYEEEDPRAYVNPEENFVDYGHDHEEPEGEDHDDEDDDDYHEEVQGEIRGGENCELGDDEKHSLRSLLEKQRLELHDEFEEDSEQNREAVSSQNLDDGRHVSHDKFNKMAEPQYNMFYGKDDLELDDKGEIIKTEDYSHLDQDQAMEEEDEKMHIDHEDQPYFAIPYPRRVRSDGELIDAYEFSLRDEESDDSIDQISLHNDGEDDYEALMDKGKKFMLEKGGKEKYFEGIMRDDQPSGSSRRGRGEHEEYEENPEGREGDEEEYQEHGHYDPRFQKGYLQGYGNMRFEGDYEGHEDEGEGYIHESDYEPEYIPEDDLARAGRVKQVKAKSFEYKNTCSEEEIASEEGNDESEQERGHERENDIGITPEQDELEQEHEEEQQQINRQGENMGENEKMVMISTINSEEEAEGGMHFSNPSHDFRNIPQRRIKSDIIVGKVENESRTQSQRDTEERKSLATSQRDSNPTRLSQKDQVSSRYQVDAGSQDIIEDQDYENHEQEGEEAEHVSVDMLDPNYNKDNADSEHFREELIQELSQYNANDKSEHQIHGGEGETDREADLEEEKVEVHPQQRRSHSGSEKGQTMQPERLSEPKTKEMTEQYQAELHRLKEEQAQKWEQMMSHLGLLTSHDELHLNKDLKSFLETLRKQSEINKQQLTEEIDPQQLLEAQAEIDQQNDNEYDNENEPNFFSNTQPSYSSTQKTMTQGVQDTRNILASNIPLSSGKKLEMISPLQESKYGKKKKPFGFAKKTNLQIDINAANEEANNGAPVDQGQLNLDLSQMRLVLGSEQLLREQSARTLSHSVSAPSDVESVDLQGPENAEATSIFERDPFKEFTRRKFKELMQHENMKNLIKMREQALEIRHKTQLDHMKKMLENRRFSPRTFQNKQIELEKWVTKERDLIQKTKKDIERGWLSTADSLQRTQRDLMFLQKLGTHADGRITNTSGDISLRHSFTDEEGAENVETQSERLSKRSFLNTGAEIRSPSSSKNIKIIDKFELKDTVYSPHVTAPTTGKKENLDEVKEDNEIEESEKRKHNLAEALGSGRKSKEFEESAKFDLEASGKSSQLSTEKKRDYKDEIIEDEKAHCVEENEEDKLQELPSEDYGFQHKKETPRKLDQEEDEGIQPEELGDEEIEWENEVLKSPLVPGDRTDGSTPGRSGLSGRREMISPGGIGENLPSISSTYSPKSQDELRFMIQERMSSFKQMQGETPTAEQELKDLEPEAEEQQAMEDHLPENLQTKTDLLCWEILDDLFNEIGEELSAPGKEHMWNKIAVLGEEPVVQPNLQNMIENNYFFHAGAEHPNFQANIPMPLSPSAEYIRLQQEKNSSSLELTPEQQANQRYQDAQTELLKTLGIKTEVAAVTRYLELLIEEINNSYKENFLRNINTPLGFSTSEKLNNMRNYDLGASDSSSLAMSSSDSQLVLEIHLYFKVEERIMEEDPNKNEVSTELEHIHNKMIFDCANEILDSFRPFGVNGQPFPWKAGSKVLKSQAITEQNMEKVLEKVKSKVIDWASYLCGYYGEGDEFVIDKTQSFIDEYLSQVREERILRMLSEEIFELENKWITYDDEEAEVEIEIADLVFDKMITETAELIAQFYDNKNGGPKMKVSNALNLNQNIKKMNQKAGFSDITKIDTDLNFNSV